MKDKTRTSIAWIALFSLIAGLAAISLYPLFKSDERKDEVKTRSLQKSIVRALKKKEEKLFPEGEYTVTFTQKEGYWFTTALVSDRDLIRLCQEKDVDRLMMRHCEITADGYARLKQEPLVDLNLFKPHLDNEIIKTISSFSGLKALTIRDNKRINDELIKHLTGPASLEELNVKNTRIGDEGLDHVAATFPSLKVLDLRACRRVSPRGLSYLSRLKALDDLNLSNIEIKMDGIKELARLKNLHKLGLVSCIIDDRKLLVLKDLPLKDLDLSENPLTNKSLEILASIKSLKELKLRYCPSIEKAAVINFNKRHPAIEVYWSREVEPKRAEDCFESPGHK
ncbi:MAG: hypothetical protein H6677_14470 [Candidatus Obscuribacterales bacterium]|nr:hypothetical protein [Candidatus Obscuribacterales bacterium]